VRTDASNLLNKVPAITLSFWVMKICATTLGETAGDLLSMTLHIGYALSTLLLLAIFVATLTAQLTARAYHPVLYWAVILSTSTAGTTMSDYLDRTLGLGYAAGALILVTLLVGVLALWRYTIGSLAVSEIRSRRVEVFYWMTILVSNTLGTALGDFLADDSGLGFAGGAAVIATAIAVIAAAAFFTRISTTILFWAAFVLTRPFGATMGDLLTKSPDDGGLGFGTVGASGILAVVLIGLIVYVTRRHRAGLSGGRR